MVIWLNGYIVEGLIVSKSIILSPKSNTTIKQYSYFNASQLRLVIQTLSPPKALPNKKIHSIKLAITDGLSH